MRKPRLVRVIIKPETKLSVLASQAKSQRTCRVSPLTTLTNSNYVSSSSSSTQKLRNSARRPTSKKIQLQKWLFIIVGIIFSVIILAAFAVSIYTLLLVEAKSKTTADLTTTPYSFYWNPEGITVAGTSSISGTASNRLNAPFGLVVDASKAVYVAEMFNCRASKWPVGSLNGIVVAGQVNGICTAVLNDTGNVCDVAIDSTNNVYVTEILKGRVQLWPVGASSGVTMAGTSGVLGNLNNQFSQAYSLTLIPNSNTLYISDTGNNRVMEYLSGATSGTVVAGGSLLAVNATPLCNPLGLHFDSSTNSLLISSYCSNNIFRWGLGDTNGTVILGSPGGVSGNTSSLLYRPRDVTMDFMGNIYVADTDNHRIQFFLAGQSSGRTIAGITRIPGNDSIHLNSPFGVALDNDGNLYVSDSSNHRVQRFDRY